MSDTHTEPTVERQVAAAPPQSPWVQLAWMGAVLAVLLLILYAGILRDLARQWWDDANYTHGFLVPLFSAFVVWQNRGDLKMLTPRGETKGVLLVLAGVAALVLGDLAAENFFMRSSLIIVLVGLVMFHLGRRALRVLVFPLAFLLFMVPLPATLLYAVTFPLQGLAATQAAWVLDLLGVPVLLDGNVIHLSQLSLGVTEACSGIRSLISLVAGAVAWAYLGALSGRMAVVFVAAALPITIVANVARVVATGLIGQWFGRDYADGFFHELAGFVVYVFAFCCLLGFYGLLEAFARRSSPAPR